MPTSAPQHDAGYLVAAIEAFVEQRPQIIILAKDPGPVANLATNSHKIRSPIRQWPLTFCHKYRFLGDIVEAPVVESRAGGRPYFAEY
jgi:hypothetical protein